MKVKHTNWHGADTESDLADFLTNTTGGYGSGGAVEQAQELARKNAEAIGRLLAWMVERGVKGIDLGEAMTIAGIYDGGAELVEDEE